MENQSNKISSDYEEIDLRDVVKILMKRKKMIFGLALAGAVIAAAITAAAPKIYSTTMLMENGKIIRNEAEQPVESVLATKEKIESGVYGDFSQMKITAAKDSNNLLFHIESGDPQEAKKIFEKIATAVIADQQKEIDIFHRNIALAVDLKQGEKKYIEEKIASLEAERKIHENKIAILEKTTYAASDLGAQVLMANAQSRLEAIRREIFDYQSIATAIGGEIFKLQSQDAKAKPAAVVNSSEAVEQSAKIIPNAVLGMVLGLMTGVFLAFIINWWRQPENEK
jgi:capsular polysaccharide biosynthesis protein